ncbi:MAG: hypothetical protein ACOYD4_01405 [Solirubrobacterales bacterium]
MISSIRQQIRAAVAAAVLAVFLLVPAALAPAAAPEPWILGTWQLGGATIHVGETGPNSYDGVIVSGSYGSCPKHPGDTVWRDLRGIGTSYSGGIPFYDTEDCGEIGDGRTTWTLSDVDHGILKTTNPIDGAVTGGPFTRIGTYTPPAGGGVFKPCEKSGKVVLCPSQTRVIRNLKAMAAATARLYKAFQKQKKSFEKVKKLEQGFGNKGKQAQKSSEEWERIKLPPTRGAAIAAIGKAQFFELGKFQNELRKLANYKQIIVGKADEFQASRKGIDTETNLDYLASANGFGPKYDGLTPEQKYKVASQAQRVTGALDQLIGMMAGAGVAATEVVFAH